MIVRSRSLYSYGISVSVTLHLYRIADTGAPAATDPAAWMIRRHAFTETNTSGETVTTHKWQVFSPLWCAGRQTLLPEGMARGWNDLPEDADSGTLYAALTWVGTATADAEGNETVTWAPGNPILTNSLADIPPDDDPTAEDTGTSSGEGKPGHRSVIVEIGDFEDADTGDDAATTFRQAHLGVIVENIVTGAGGLPDGTEVWGKVAVEAQTNGSSGTASAYNIYQSKQTWDAATSKFVDKPDSKTLVGTIPAGGSAIADGTLIPGAVEYVVVAGPSSGSGGEPSSVKFVQHYLKWDAASGTFVAAGESADVVITELTSHAEDHEVEENA